MLVGKRIKEARKNKGLSQEELGNILKVSKVSVCGYEKGNRTPTLETFIELIDCLDIDTDYALGRDKNIIRDNDTTYSIKMSEEEINIIKELRNNKGLYNKLCEDPKRTIELIDKKMKK